MCSIVGKQYKIVIVQPSKTFALKSFSTKGRKVRNGISSGILLQFLHRVFFFFYRYDTSTLAENYSGAAHYGNEEDLNQVLRGIGLRSVLLILVSSLCLVLASIGVCICLRKSNQMQCCDAALLRRF